MGQFAWPTTFSAVLPDIRCLIPVRPRVARTMRSALSFCAVAQISGDWSADAEMAVARAKINRKSSLHFVFQSFPDFTLGKKFDRRIQEKLRFAFAG